MTRMWVLRKELGMEMLLTFSLAPVESERKKSWLLEVGLEARGSSVFILRVVFKRIYPSNGEKKI